MKPLKYPVAVACLCVFSVQPALSQTRLWPVDQASKAPEFFVFRAQLQNAVARHDAEAVLAMIDPEVQMGFGPEQGLQDFKAKWQPQQPGSALWDTLSSILSLGGAFNRDGSFAAPYVWARWPGSHRGMGHVAVLGSSVRVRATPHLTAAVLGTLNFAIVELAQPPHEAVPAGWRAIRWQDRKTAYVRARDVRSPLDHHMVMRQIDGVWRVTSLMAGD